MKARENNFNYIFEAKMCSISCRFLFHSELKIMQKAENIAEQCEFSTLTICWRRFWYQAENFLENRSHKFMKQFFKLITNSIQLCRVENAKHIPGQRN